MSQVLRMPAAFLALRKDANADEQSASGSEDQVAASHLPKQELKVQQGNQEPQPTEPGSETSVQAEDPESQYLESVGDTTHATFDFYGSNAPASEAAANPGAESGGAELNTVVKLIPDESPGMVSPLLSPVVSTSNLMPKPHSHTSKPRTNAVPSAAAVLALTTGSRVVSFTSTAAQSAVSLTPSMPADANAYDRYGFRKRSQHISQKQFDEWFQGYEEYQKGRKAKWVSLLEDNGLTVSENEAPVRFPPNSERLKRYIRKGIPTEWRGSAWFWFAKGHDKLIANQGVYDQLVKESAMLQNSDTDHIERDLNRTFPDNIHFRSVAGEVPEKIKALRRVLVAFSVYQPKIGYCQSLNYIAGTLLLFMEEEKAFWMLVIITNNFLQGLHEVNLEQVNIAQGILMISIRDRLPKVWNALGLDQQCQDNFVAQLPQISLCTAGWFMCMFVCVLPTETMLRVWDVFFFEGPKVLYRVSLTLLKMLEPTLAKTSDDAEVFQTIQGFPQQMLDVQSLMRSCFRRSNGFGHLTDADILALRQFVGTRRRQAQAGNVSGTDREEYAKYRPRQRLRSHLFL